MPSDPIVGTKAKVLVKIGGGLTLRETARQLGKAPSTIHGHAQSLSSMGLVTNETGRYVLTSEGESAYQNLISGGLANSYRTPPRVHKVQVQGPIIGDRPPDELLEERLPEGTGMHEMENWPDKQFTGPVLDVGKDVLFQIDLQNVKFFVHGVAGSPAQAVQEGLKFAAKSKRRHHQEAGLRIGELRFSGGVEFAYPRHPVAYRWIRDYGKDRSLAPDFLWVDESKGFPELEAERWRLAAAVEQATEGFNFGDGWLLEPWMDELKNACPDDLEKQIWDAPDWSLGSGTL